VAATSAGTDIELQGATIFAGNGNIVLGIDNNNARINGTGTLTNTANHTIQGRGNIGFNTLGILNEGTINADQAGGVPYVDPSAAGILDNNGIMRSSAGGLLQLSGGGGGLFENTGGMIQAIGAGSEVQLYSGASIVGGVLQAQAGGLIRGNTSDDYFFTDVTFSLGTQVRANNNSDFGVLGTITNLGTITMAATSAGTDIELQGDTAFIGGGEIVLGLGNNNARINGTGTLTNGSCHTIRGRGNVGFGTLAVFNAQNATIVADQPGAPLFLDPIAGVGSFDNRGLLAATDGGRLQLSGTGGGSFDNVGGIIRAGDGSEVQLLSNVSIDGGMIESQGSGLVRLETSQSATISNATILANSAINNNATLFLSGDITHSGNLSINATSAGTALSIDSILDLNGGGSIRMTGGNSRILGTGVLINRDHVISGIGNIGFNQAAITNSAQGAIHADISGGTLFIDPNAVLGFVNDGVLRASGGGTLDLSGSGGGQFTFSDSSVVEALDGGSITHRSGAFLTNLEDGILTDGTYRVIDEGNGASLNLAGGNILTNAASIELSGAGAMFAQLSTLNENAGSLTVDKGAELALSGDFSQVSSGSLTVGIGGAAADTSLWGKITSVGTAALNGALEVMFNIGNTFAAAIGNAWKVLASSERIGEFSDVTFTAEGLPENSKLAVNYLADGVEVEVVPASAELLPPNCWPARLTQRGQQACLKDMILIQRLMRMVMVRATFRNTRSPWIHSLPRVVNVLICV
jgi:hypothetical protein